ncbi:MAG: tRNA lysidine(34) synthetase TilS [Saprospiraceae bacterium]|nr:tRNA lysidine(34) synthetase TilS [Saprospiraceae bacterium]
MLDRFASFMREENISPEKQRILIAVSGGVDSMVLVDLFMKAGFSVGIAHVNYGMRAQASDDDEKMVTLFATEHDIPFYRVTFPLDLKAKGNFQQQARNFRYHWFNQLCNDHHFDFVATGHHANDDAEGFLMNLLRASGINGLSGLKVRSENILRPLLTFEKSEIYDYARSFSVPYREDESNSKSIYLRNAIRNTVLPGLQVLNSDAVRQIQRSARQMAESSALLHRLIETGKYCLPHGHGWVIPLEPVLEIPESKVLLFFVLKVFGFNRTQCDNILDADTGGWVANDTYIARKERTLISINPQEKEKSSDFEMFLRGPGTLEFNEITLSFSWYPDDRKTQDKDYDVVLSFDENPFPLVIRSKRQGDKFMPSGMEGHSKTVKKFFTDLKLNARQKANAIIVEGSSGIYCVAPYRVAEGYTYNPEKKFALMISYCI